MADLKHIKLGDTTLDIVDETSQQTANNAQTIATNAMTAVSSKQDKPTYNASTQTLIFS